MLRSQSKIRVPLGRFESLERRTLMAGDVQVALSAADARDLEITGDNLGNEIIVEEIAADRIRVRGLNGTTVNGSSNSVTLTVTDDVTVKMQGGSDKVTIRNLNLENYSHSDLNIDLGTGHDELDLLAVDVARHLKTLAGHGNDDVLVDETSAADIEVDGEYGNDDILVDQSRADLDIIVDGGEDDDNLTIDDSRAGDDIRTYGDAGDDRIEVNDVSAADDIYVDAGSGHDGLVQVNYSAAEDLYLYGREGDDSTQVYENDISDYIYVSLGTGDDYFFLSGNDAGRHYFHGGTGTDRISAYFGNWFWTFSNTYSF